MIIGIDGNEANVTQRVGVSVYTFELLKRFAMQASQECQFDVFLRAKPRQDLPVASPFFRYHIIFGPAMWLRFFLPLNLAFAPKLDVFFSPAHYSPPGLRMPLVVTVHDLAYFYFKNDFLAKDLYKLTNWTKESVTKATNVIAVSRTTKKDILKHYQVADERVSVIYNGYNQSNDDSQLRSQTEVEESYNIPHGSRYILYVGTIQPRKNLKFLIETFAVWHKKHPQDLLVIVGKKGWLYQELFSTIPDSIKQYIRFTGFVSDQDVTVLYQNAFCYVLPSLYEGFGIPLLEAMSHNCPVVASSKASLPEIGGEASLYFSPDKPDELMNAWESLEANPNLRSELIAKGKERLLKFSWDTCAQETLALLKITGAKEKITL